VRFRDGGLLHSLVLRALREGLAKADLTPAAADLGSSGLRGLPGGAANRLGQADGRGVFGSPASGFRHIAWAPPVPEGASGGEPGLREPGLREPALREPGLREPGLLGAAAPLRSGLVPGAAAPPAAHPAGSLSDAKFAEFFATRYQPGESLPASLAGGLAGGLATAGPSEAQRGWSPVLGAPAPVPILHVHDKYVVTLDEAGLVIIDQHALHERVMFERLLARIASGPLESQPLLTPIVVPSTRDAVAMLDGLSPLLARLGLSLAALGPQTVGVQSAPTLLIERRVDIGVFARELLDKALRGELGEGSGEGSGPGLGAGELRPQHEHALRDVLDMMACKAAIKAGDKLSDLELRELLHLRESVERSSNCPHGRPTSMRVTLRELDRLFGRS